MLSDPEVAGVIIEANTGEAGAGQVATARASAPAVLTFAQRMIDEHSAANRRLTMLVDQLSITPSDSAIRRMLGMQAHEAVDMLWAAPASAFDRMYMQGQVDMHMMVLDLIDSVLLPSATNAMLKMEVMTMRMAVVTHLADARSVLAGLNADGGANGSADGGSDSAGDGAGSN
jgi:putative membrane protein